LLIEHENIKAPPFPWTTEFLAKVELKIKALISCTRIAPPSFKAKDYEN
jgi:hypothetical protein